MPRCLILDTYYPEFLKTLPPLTGTYDEELRRLLDRCFGTFDAYSKNLRDLGWEVQDVVANHHQLQHLWAKSEKWSLPAIALQQIEAFKPDVLFLQDLSFFDASTLRMLSDRYTLAGQCSCPLPRSENIARFDVIFSSVPPHVEHFKSLGVRGEYLPLAFEHTLLDRILPQERDIDVSFVGGVGASLHWKAGTHALEALASAIGERFHWYGYGLDRLATDSPLRKCYRGEAWGLDMYRIYGRSKIVVNRHGEVSQGYANNLRMYEATGMGACLTTEYAPNIMDLFISLEFYSVEDHPEDGLIGTVEWLLKSDCVREIAAERCKQITLDNHTYAHRMKRVSEVLTECLQKTAV